MKNLSCQVFIKRIANKGTDCLIILEMVLLGISSKELLAYTCLPQAGLSAYVSEAKIKRKPLDSKSALTALRMPFSVFSKLPFGRACLSANH